MAEKQVKDYEKFVVRFPDGMRDAVAERAKENGRSMNSEIVDMISNALSQPDLAQEGIDLLIGLSDPEGLARLPYIDKDEIHEMLIDAATILARRVENETDNLRKILFLLSRRGPLRDNTSS